MKNEDPSSDRLEIATSLNRARVSNNPRSSQLEVTASDGTNYLIQDGKWANTERERGILTKGDRKYLLDQASLEGQDRRNTRYRIRQRLSNALLDIALLAEVAIDKDLKQVLEKEDIDNEFIAEATTLFAYDLIRHSSRFENPIDAFETMIASALEERAKGRDPDVGELVLSRVRSEANLEVEVEEIGTTVEKEDGRLTIELDPSAGEEFEELADSIVEQLEEVTGERYLKHNQE